VVLDQAYAEYDDDAPTRAAAALDNVVTVRSLSKAWGLAGLRVGYAVGHPEIIEAMRAVGQPYAVSGPSAEIAVAALEGGAGWMRAHVRRVREERDALAETLLALGARPRPSRANFVLAGFDDAPWVADALAGLGIAVRRFPGRPGLSDSLRITCPGSAPAFERLLAGLRAAAAPEAVLFDMDGVLADASGSYREAIARTAARFGVEATPEAIRGVKAEGDANNDWVVTERLLRASGVDVPLDEITAEFERLYQGAEGRPGLKATERLLADRGALDRIRERVPLAVVTGRPRRDAEEFLARFGIRDRFDAIVTMEDAKPKPDPAPVRRALEVLGVSSAWMVGDTPDDVRAARGAGVVPIGVVAPGDGDTMRDALLQAGAARVVRDVEEVATLLRPTTDGGRTR
jgi:histidinol-phosphate aminotransferase